MAINNFTRMLHKKTQKITRILNYVVLEWILILLILLNSLFSYFIRKFALYFGLKPPCLFCSRLDHLLNSQISEKTTISSYKEFICDNHATELSKIGFCSNHGKVLESKIVCDNCSSFSGENDGLFFNWMKEIGIIEVENELKKCCCCDLIIEPRKFSDLNSPYFDFMANLITEKELEGCFPDQERGNLIDFEKSGDSGYELLNYDEEIEEETQVVEAENEPLLCINNNNNNIIISNDYNNNNIVSTQNLCSEMLPQHLEFYIDHDDYRLIPVEIVAGSVKFERNNEEIGGNDKKIETLEEICREVDLGFERSEILGFCELKGKNLESIEEVDEIDEVSEENLQEIDEEKMGIEKLCETEENSFSLCETESEPVLEGIVETGGEIVDAENIVHSVSAGMVETSKVVDEAENSVIPVSSDLKEEMEFHLRRDEASPEKMENWIEHTPCEDDSPTITDDGSINIASVTPFTPKTITENGICEVSTSSIQLPSTDENDADVNEGSLNVDVGLSNNGIDEEKIPDTPTSTESLHLQKKILFLGRMGSSTEESVDGSIISGHGGGDGVTLIEKLKLELQSEKNTLRALYAELEEERNASAVAANQTMAMINRLQEEKATMQMEALQYQRMMEEQSEYDQEALQMMNELMVKREKEKQELEKELEVYRKKLLDFEEREKVRILARRMEGSMRSRNSSASCSYGEESDGLSIDLNHEVKDQEEETNGLQDTPSDSFLNLHETLGSFDDERQSILEQLKVLEEKLFILAEEEEEEDVENMRQYEGFYDEDGKDVEVNGDENGKHQDGWINGSMQKRLLPLFDEVESLDSPNGMLYKRDGYQMVVSKSSINKLELEKKRLAIEEGVDHVYERLHSLEADREFLKHCIGSLRKGDKGLDLLQEILQHLRDLKNVELQVVKNPDPCSAV